MKTIKQHNKIEGKQVGLKLQGEANLMRTWELRLLGRGGLSECKGLEAESGCGGLSPEVAG